MFKHLVSWLLSAFGSLEIDARCRSIPPNHHIIIFAKGISRLSRITGKEHKNMSRFLLGLVLDLPVTNGQESPQIIMAVRTLLDFLYLAQLTSHSSSTLARMEESLSHFHDNKDIFVELRICNHFKYSKLHSLLHYVPLIQLFGTTDNYNTEQTEQLHIDTTKDAYNATNHKDEYHQMTTWTEHHEKVQLHSSFIKWRQRTNRESAPSLPATIGPPHPSAHRLTMAQLPTLKAISFNDLVRDYGAIEFQDALVDFIAQTNNPMASGATLSALASDTLIPFRAVPVYHKIKFSNPNGSKIINSIQVRPDQKDSRGHQVPS